MKINNSHILERINVENKLASGLLTPLTVVTSPMGYGKTTAVRSFLRKRNDIVLWTTMSSAGNTANGEYFWLLLTREIFNISPEMSRQLDERGFPGDSAQIFRFINILKKFPRSSGHRVILVIDDYWLIENREINDLILRLTSENLAWLNLILISRRKPRLPIEELVMKGLCVVIDYDDLTFSWKDARNYFSLIGLIEDEKIQKQIYEDSKGWIAALYLMSKNYFSGQPIEDLKRMLKDSLFEKYDEARREALVKLSYFDTISPKQAAYIFDDCSMPVLLEQFYKDNAFITLDSKCNYKFHQIFLNFLRDEQTKYRFDTDTIYRRAGEWFAANDDHMMAFHYWQLSGDYESIFEFLEAADISHINSLDRKLIFPVFNATDTELWYRYPIATLKYIFLLILYNEREYAGQLLNDLDAYFRKAEYDRYCRSQLLAELQIVRTSLAFNDMTELIEHSKEAYRLFDGKVSLMRKRSGVYTYGCPHFSYMYYNKPGMYRKLIEEIKNGFDYHIRACNGCGAGADLLTQAEYYLETGDFDKVKLLASEARYVSEQHEQTCITAASMFVLARLHHITGNTAEMNEVIGHMELMREKENNPLNSDVLDNALGYMYVLLDRVEKIPVWLREDDITYRFSAYQGTSFNHLVYQMILIRKKDYETFSKKKDSFLMEFRQFKNQLGIVIFHINNSVALYHTIGTEAAAAELDMVFDIARKDHLTLVFAENACEVMPILENGSFNSDKEFIAEVREICRRYHELPKKRSSSSFLSKRETDIMELLEDGINIADIADALYISQNTVKRHLQNIYRKFNVHNKTLALKAYRELCEKDDS